MEVTLKVSAAWTVLDRYEVSILVLMEVTLKVKRPSLTAFATSRFNPCFNGSDSKSALASPCVPGSLGFNPCFNGSDSKRRLSGSRAPRHPAFQSLF